MSINICITRVLEMEESALKQDVRTHGRRTPWLGAKGSVEALIRGGNYPGLLACESCLESKLQC